ncbi:hypothetical protein MBUL_00847 [Methylobacterium bullatum]|uniref:Uncharacterized protein n=1 Tax=Methylobacterium bullatum TaxID=570505 RepID=A0A679IQB8_9HYPH|nr:hypothetical protein MBUL_00847 [Methylobacterium bullatum]
MLLQSEPNISDARKASSSAICPGYRLRLFLSVDLVGSTGYKAGKGKDLVLGTARQRWVDETRHFYREFPKSLQRDFNSAPISGDASDGLCPQVWKTVGDEIIFCVRLNHAQHLGRCLWSFTKSLKDYSNYLEKGQIELDVKGVAWIAAFPAPNITVPVSMKHVLPEEGDKELLDDEEIELEGDRTPSNFEFLGKEIDTGFRVSKHAGPDKLAMSIETAYILSGICAQGDYTFSFTYSGREGLKGVIGGRPYPIISIDTERRQHRRDVRAFEQAISGEKDATPQLLRTFLEAFMKDERIDLPYLPMKGEEFEDSRLPENYKAFKKYWLEEHKETEQRQAVEDQAGNDEVTEPTSELLEPDPESLAAIEADAQRLLEKFHEPGAAPLKLR